MTWSGLYRNLHPHSQNRYLENVPSHGSKGRPEMPAVQYQECIYGITLKGTDLSGTSTRVLCQERSHPISILKLIWSQASRKRLEPALEKLPIRTRLCIKPCRPMSVCLC